MTLPRFLRRRLSDWAESIAAEFHPPTNWAERLASVATESTIDAVLDGFATVSTQYTAAITDLALVIPRLTSAQVGDTIDLMGEHLRADRLAIDALQKRTKR